MEGVFIILILMPLNLFAAEQRMHGSLAELVRKRYQSFDTEIGAQVEVTCFLFLFCHVF
jgi:hypothetical protein